MCKSHNSCLLHRGLRLSLKSVYINSIMDYLNRISHIYLQVRVNNFLEQYLIGKMAARGKEIRPSNQREVGRKELKREKKDEL